MASNADRRSISAEDFLLGLVATGDELAPFLNEHLEDNFGEMLPHLLMADVTRWVVEQTSTAGVEPSTSVLRVLAAIEEAVTPPGPSAEVDDLVRASFLENLQEPTGFPQTVTALLGPHLHEMLADF